MDAFLKQAGKNASTTTAVSSQIEQIYRSESRKVFATLVRLLGDFDLAEEALHEAFAAAIEADTDRKIDSWEQLENDRLRLIFTCCHPALSLEAQVPLTLREVRGLSTEEIARAFLIAPTTLAQRIVRGRQSPG